MIPDHSFMSGYYQVLRHKTVETDCDMAHIFDIHNIGLPRYSEEQSIISPRDFSVQIDGFAS